jgi:hypothetical protein
MPAVAREKVSWSKTFLVLQAAVSTITFFASTFRHETVLEETAFALGAEGFEYCIDRENKSENNLRRHSEARSLCLLFPAVDTHGWHPIGFAEEA